jgi:hypothetical protein
VLAVADLILGAGAVGAFIGGIGAAVGGVGAWNAAKASLSAADQARNALALGLHPRLNAHYTMEGGGGGTLNARVQVRNDLSSRDLALEIRFRDGRLLRANRDSLGPAPSEMSKMGPVWIERWEGVLKAEEGDDAFSAVSREVEYGALRWWDREGIGRWEELTRFSPGTSPEVGPDQRIA